MTEILLKCPKCETEYRLPASAIPPAGREVECTMCNNSWFAQVDEPVVDDTDHLPDEVTDEGESTASGVVRHAPSHSRAADEDGVSSSVSTPVTGDMPPLRRQLPDNVLKILREEVEFERRARLGEKDAPPASDLSDPAANDRDDLWPATTITASVAAKATEPTDAKSTEAGSVSAEPVAADTRISLDQPVQSAPILTSEAPKTEITSEQSISVETSAPTQPATKARSGYFSGFGVALIAAAIALAMYLVPPQVVGTGGLADGLSQYQQQVDAGRGWLQQKASGLLKGL